MKFAATKQRSLTCKKCKRPANRAFRRRRVDCKLGFMELNGLEVSTSRQVDTCARKRRRRWSEAEKRRIVAETQDRGASVSVVARRHDVNANQLFAWRRRYRADASGRSPGGLVPVSLVSPPGAAPAPGVIEIGFGGGITVRVLGAVEGAALAQVLTVLSGRPDCSARDGR